MVAVAVICRQAPTVTAAAAAEPQATPSYASALLYDYSFVGVKDTVKNSAPDGPTAPMTLFGPVVAAPQGVRFHGNLSGTATVGYARPAGVTLDEPASTAVGIGVHFRYREPLSGTCNSDSLNISQVGRDQSFQPEAKIQLTNCEDSRSRVYLQCRFAGALTSTDVFPVTSSVAMRSGDRYLVTCRKTPDHNGEAHVQIAVTDLTAKHPTRVKQRFTVAALGRMLTSRFVSVGNKYPLPSVGTNTDQFQGLVTRTVVCVGTSAVVQKCLTRYTGA